MKIVYDKRYFDNYYDGPYDATFQYGFSLDDILGRCWDTVYEQRPKSFADIGSGPGQTLLLAETLLPDLEHLYGVEVQEIPEKERVHSGVIIGDFLEISRTLKPVELLYCACSMYVPWEEQAYFLSEVLRLATKAICFANVYLTDRHGIPEDIHRKVIYKSRPAFAEGIESIGGWRRVYNQPGYDFFVKDE